MIKSPHTILTNSEFKVREPIIVSLVWGGKVSSLHHSFKKKFPVVLCFDSTEYSMVGGRGVSYWVCLSVCLSVA